MEHPNHIELLFKKLLNNECSPEEVEELISWLTDNETQDQSESLIQLQLASPVGNNEINADISKRLEKRLQAILENDTDVNEITPKVTHLTRRRYRWWAAAAAIIVLLGTGVYLLWQPETAQIQQVESTKIPADAMPGKNGAILTLSNGQQIVLDSLSNGIIATQGNVEVSLKEGKIIYDEKEAASPVVAVSYNKVTTPRARQYQVLLPDGTKVWLNAASSLSYPTAFTGSERRIEVTGEAYFEVAKNADKPFRVKINDSTEVEVVGTHFNVNAYQDEESINITLLEGAVRVSHNDKTRSLQPGQQAQVTDELNLVQEVDLKQVMAWKDGRFEFGESTDLKDIMRQISRWYDVDIEFRENFHQSFGGSISRYVNISKVLEKLQMTGRVHFAIEGNKIIVTR